MIPLGRFYLSGKSAVFWHCWLADGMVDWGEKWGVGKGYLTVYGIWPVIMKEYMIQ
jgi:hypothetical protein